MSGHRVIRSNLSIKGILLLLLLVGCIYLLGAFGWWGIRQGCSQEVVNRVSLLSGIFMFALSALCFVTLIYANYRATIDLTARTLTHYSLRHPCGRITDLTACIGYLTQKQSSRAVVNLQYYRSESTVLHLVDRNYRVHFGLSKLFYHNYDQLTEALGLPRIYTWRMDTSMAIRASFGFKYSIRNIGFEHPDSKRSKKA